MKANIWASPWPLPTKSLFFTSNEKIAVWPMLAASTVCSLKTEASM